MEYTTAPPPPRGVASKEIQGVKVIMYGSHSEQVVLVIISEQNKPLAQEKAGVTTVSQSHLEGSKYLRIVERPTGI